MRPVPSQNRYCAGSAISLFARRRGDQKASVSVTAVIGTGRSRAKGLREVSTTTACDLPIVDIGIIGSIVWQYPDCNQAAPPGKTQQ